MMQCTKNMLKNDAVHQKYFTIFSESPELDGGRSWKNEEVPRKQEMSQSGGGKNIFYNKFLSQYFSQQPFEIKVECYGMRGLLFTEQVGEIFPIKVQV